MATGDVCSGCFAHKNKIPATLKLQLQSTFQVSFETLQVDKCCSIDTDAMSQAILRVWVSEALPSWLLLVFQKHSYQR